jgi:hypothetical protein
MDKAKQEKPPQIEMDQLQLQIQGLTQMVERFNLVICSIHERLERVERRGADGEHHSADRDGNHAKRCNRYVSLVVDIDFNAIDDENDDVASWDHRDQIWQPRNHRFHGVKRAG